VFDSYDAVRRFIDDKPVGSQWVVQKYIEKPLLIEGRKFDVRAYVLVTPSLDVYMYETAYVRTSSTQYSLHDLRDRALHLTNDAVQCKTGGYGEFEDSNKLTLEDMQARIGPGYDVGGKLYPRMRDIARHVFGALGGLLNPQGLSYCFELFGLDFMLDEGGAVSLIEVNTSPALLRHGALLSELIPKVVEEVVQKCVDPYFPDPATGLPYVSPRPLSAFTPLPGVAVGPANANGHFFSLNAGRAAVAAGKVAVPGAAAARGRSVSPVRRPASLRAIQLGAEMPGASAAATVAGGAGGQQQKAAAAAAVEKKAATVFVAGAAEEPAEAEPA
jgi:hypothetical protein